MFVVVRNKKFTNKLINLAYRIHCFIVTFMGNNGETFDDFF